MPSMGPAPPPPPPPPPPPEVHIRYLMGRGMSAAQISQTLGFPMEVVQMFAKDSPTAQEETTEGIPSDT